ncbi:MAG: lectin like domain-containing protein [Methanofollis sp.]|uniref:lectin like domain-containing protein n=1 Tax=Methanofollis sp. TaxID=2052835 RepID=UPI00263862B0|nr:lectin like domain-containing protein [Methanofollis sp.]MDD4253917.1 lectin like domain-containing protein [Methanofollis sp.]
MICAVALLLVVQGASAQQYTCAPLNPAFVSDARGEDAIVSSEPANGMLLMSTAESPHPLTGLRPAPATLVWSDQSGVSAGSNALLPSTFDLRDDGRLTPVKDQGQAGSCWAFATYASLESTLLADTGIAWDFSENNMKDLCSNLYPDGFDRGPYDGGHAFMSTAYLTRWSGPVNETDDLYDLPLPQNDSRTDLPPVVHVQNVTFLPPRTGPLDNDLIKETIRGQGALWVGFTVNWTCFDDIDTCLTYYRPDNGTYKIDGGHAVALVGWDDTYPAANFSVAPPGPGAFIAKNSWGEGVGDGGCFYISYYEPELGSFSGENSIFVGDDLDSYASVLFTGEAVDSLDHVYQYDPLGWTTSIGTSSSTTLYGANVFTADGYEDLRSVSFYTREPGTDYVVAVFRDIDEPPGNASGPVAWVNGTADLPGYHTIPLPEAVSLAPGQTFSVVLKVDAPTDPFPLVVEMPIADYSSNATAGPGESYVSVDGDSWIDLPTIFSNTNVCIKAFTTAAIVVPRDYPTIQEAVDAAMPGETVWVESGTYDEHVAVNKTISLLGIDTGDGLPTIDPGNAYCGVSISANNTVLEGFRVVRDGEDTYTYAGVRLSGDTIVLRDVAVAGSEVGLEIGDVSALTLRNTSMTDNRYNLVYACDNLSPGNDIDTGNTVDGRPVVYLERVSGVTVGADAGAVICVNASDVTARDLSLDHQAYGILALDTQNLTVANTTFENVSVGVYAVRSEDLTISENRFGRGTAFGIMLAECPHTQVEGNAFDEVKVFGVYSNLGQDQTISGNRIAGSPVVGIATLLCSDSEVSDNIVNASEYGILATGIPDYGMNLSVKNNTMAGSPVFGIIGQNLDNLTLSGNVLSGNEAGIRISGCAAANVADNTVTYGDGGVGMYIVASNATITGNSVEGAGAMAVLEGGNIAMTRNTFSGTDYPVVETDEGSESFSVYMNSFICTPASGRLMTVQADGPVTSLEESLDDLPAGQASSVQSVLGSLPGDSVALTAAVATSPVVSWHSPAVLTYWYHGTGYANLTGNYWSTYDGADANGDGIGDTPFVIPENETDLYPLMDRFEAYSTTPPHDSGDSSSDGTVGASGNLNPGATASLHFMGSAVTTINVTAGQRIDGVMVTVAPVAAGPDGLEVLVYQYLAANLTYATDDAISEAVFTFSVPASWLKEQGLAPGGIALWRYHDGAWTALPTEVLREEGDRVVYRAVSPGFSYFAVAGGEAMLPEQTKPAPAVGSKAEITPVETVQTPPINTTAPGAAATSEPSGETAPATTPQESPLVFTPVLALGALLLLRRWR